MTSKDNSTQNAGLSKEFLLLLAEFERNEKERNACTIGALLGAICHDGPAKTDLLLAVVELAFDLIYRAVSHPCADAAFLEDSYGMLRGALDDLHDAFFPEASTRPGLFDCKPGK